ncbi:hypothetical protein Q3H58_003508 [Pseudomonas psychrotolerans]|nr:hypothetical protein [Pseudomonas psychrotolerans]
MSASVSALGVVARDPELGQTKIRLAFVLPVSVYVIGAWAWGLFDTGVLLANLACYALFTLLALALFFEECDGDRG